jgi:hypothetical protein
MQGAEYVCLMPLHVCVLADSVCLCCCVPCRSKGLTLLMPTGRWACLMTAGSTPACATS